MLEYNPEKRISAAEAFMHPWIQTQEFNVFKPDVASDIALNLGRFCVNPNTSLITFIVIIYSLRKSYNKLQ